MQSTSRRDSTSVTTQKRSTLHLTWTSNASNRSSLRKTLTSASKRTTWTWLTRLWVRFTCSGRRCASLSCPWMSARMASSASRIWNSTSRTGESLRMNSKPKTYLTTLMLMVMARLATKTTSWQSVRRCNQIRAHIGGKICPGRPGLRVARLITVG